MGVAVDDANSPSQPAFSCFPGGSLKVGLVAVGISVTVALFVLAWVYANFPGDEEVLVRLQSFRNGWLDKTVAGLAKIGLLWVFLPATAVFIGGFLAVRRYADGAMVFAGVVAIGIGNSLKLLVDRPRPEYHMIGPVPSDFSFPSGHSLMAFVMGGILVYLVECSVKPLPLRRAIQSGLVLAVLAMGASRVYAGVHWPSDVIGAYVLGIMALVGLIAFRKAVSSDR